MLICTMLKRCFSRQHPAQTKVVHTSVSMLEAQDSASAEMDIVWPQMDVTVTQVNICCLFTSTNSLSK